MSELKTFEDILRKNCIVKIDTENGYEFTDVPLQRIIDSQKEYEAQSPQSTVIEKMERLKKAKRKPINHK